MQAHVKMHHIKIDIKGDIPPDILDLLIKKYGKKLKLIKDEGDELIDITKTEWFNLMKAKLKPGDAMKHYRKIYQMTQTELGEKLGGISRQHISDMENGRRPISLNTAKYLSKIFKRSVERFFVLE
ncbi:helix-turn-helix transcriptional regulator [Spirochaetota bacterium]